MSKEQQALDSLKGCQGQLRHDCEKLQAIIWTGKKYRKLSKENIKNMRDLIIRISKFGHEASAYWNMANTGGDSRVKWRADFNERAASEEPTPEGIVFSVVKKEGK